VVIAASPRNTMAGNMHATFKGHRLVCTKQGSGSIPHSRPLNLAQVQWCPHLHEALVANIVVAAAAAIGACINRGSGGAGQ